MVFHLKLIFLRLIRRIKINDVDQMHAILWVFLVKETCDNILTWNLEFHAKIVHVKLLIMTSCPLPLLSSYLTSLSIGLSLCCIFHLMECVSLLILSRSYISISSSSVFSAISVDAYVSNGVVSTLVALHQRWGSWRVLRWGCTRNIVNFLIVES